MLDLVVGNTFFAQLPSRQVTVYNVGSNPCSALIPANFRQINFVLTNTDWLHVLQDVASCMDRALASHHVFFFLRAFFRNCLLFRLFYWSVSRQTRNTRGKSAGPMQVLTGVEGCRLVVLAIEVGGRWSEEAAAFVSNLARAKARQAPTILQQSVAAALTLRWTATLTHAARTPFAATLLGEATPNIYDVETNHPKWSLVEEFWVDFFFAFAGILQSGSCEPSCSASGLAFPSEW